MKTKTTILLMFLATFLHFGLQAQEKEKIRYTFGAGATHDGNLLLWGLNFVNEVDIPISKRFTFTPSLTFYHSIGTTEPNGRFASQKSEDFSSGIFFNPKLKYDILQKDNGFKLSLSAGPSLNIGSQSFVSPFLFSDPDEPELILSSRSFVRLGLWMELEAEWNTKNPNIKNGVGLSVSGYEKYMPWYINATYKIKFKSFGN